MSSDKPRLWYHDRRELGEELPESLCTALERLTSAEGQANALTGNDMAAFRALLKRLDQGHLWLVCGCRGDVARDGMNQNHAILFPRRRPGASLHLVRKGKLTHAAGCPFDALSRVKSQAGVDVAPTSGRWDGDWLAVPAGTPPSKGRWRPAGGPDRGGARESMLERQLWTLLDEAGYTALNISELKEVQRGMAVAHPKAHYGLLHQLDDKGLGNDANVRFRDIFCTFLPALPAFLATPRTILPSRNQVRAFFFGLVDEIELEEPAGRAAVLVRHPRPREAGSVEIRMPVCLETRRSGGEISGPYWVLARIENAGSGIEGRDGAAGGHTASAFAAPAVDRACLFPLREESDRELVALAVDQARFWRTQGIRVPVRLRAPIDSIARPAIEIEVGALGVMAIARSEADVARLETAGRYFGVLPPPGDHGIEWRRLSTAMVWRLLRSRHKSTSEGRS